ncbi:hypothetical protein BKA69DRAFT_1101235 [Paraphysoderma sedebokerense]|nr:hypothetical protein BKA69DRAFT_1101235 [Paraphysoderma sedebokerense]
MNCNHLIIIALLLLSLSSHSTPSPSSQRPFLFDPNSEPESPSQQFPPPSAEWIPEWSSHLVHTIEKFAKRWNRFGTFENCSSIPIPSFDCDVEQFEFDDGLSDMERNADKVRPVDIKLIASLGDSITAGFGMITGRPPLSKILEYRGKVFSIGTDVGELTIPNLLKLYNPKVIGASTGVTLPLSEGKDLNRAISGSRSNSLQREAQSLLTLLSIPPYSLHKKSWKMITVLIGANNLCRACVPNSNDADADLFENDLRDSLLLLRNGLQKTIVNVLGLFNVSQVYTAAENSESAYCQRLLSHFPFCPCLTPNTTHHEMMDSLSIIFNQRIKKVVSEFRGLHDFGVRYDDALVATNVSQYSNIDGIEGGNGGEEMLSKLDCFHPNICANKVMTVQVWNGLWTQRRDREGDSQKETDLSWKCPGKGNMYIKL